MGVVEVAAAAVVVEGDAVEEVREVVRVGFDCLC